MITALAFLRGLPWRFIAAAIAVLGLLWFVYTRGVDNERGRWELKQAQQVKADAAAYHAQTKEDNAFTARAASLQAQLQAQFDQLKEVQHVAIQQFKLVATRPPVVNNLERSGNTARCTSETTSSTPTAPGTDSAADSDGVLTLGALWLWNAALTGQGATTGACRIDAATGQASAACGAASGIDITAAWDNHATNAASCALDRANHQRLIDFIKSRP